MKSPSSMKNGIFHPPKYRSKVQKMEVLYTHSPKMPCPSPNVLIIPFFFLNKRIRKFGGGGRGGEGGRHREQPIVCQTMGHDWRVTDGRPPALCECPKFPLAKILLLLAHIFLHMWSILGSCL
jgi:hypothetical protein